MARHINTIFWFLLLVCVSVYFVCAKNINSMLADHTVIYVDKSSLVKDSSCWHGGLEKPCYSLELALAGVKNISASPAVMLRPWIFLKPGTYHLEGAGNSSFSGPVIHDFGLVANGSETALAGDKPNVTVSCTKGAGFRFFNISLITIRNVWFNGCGSVQPSTSTNVEKKTFWEFRVGLYFLLCSDIDFEHVWVTHTQGIGTFLYSSSGSNKIQTCSFSSNAAASDSTYPAGGGLYIEFSSCIPINVNSCTPRTESSYDSQTNILISGSEFEDNSANVSKEIAKNDIWLLPNASNHSSIGRGGGLSIVFKGYSKNNNVQIKHSSFSQNSALWGGGLFVEFQDNSSQNVLNITNAHFLRNEVQANTSASSGTGGGGARIGYIFYKPSRVSDNTVSLTHCEFDENVAYWGGGVSFYAAREEDVLVPTNKLEFDDCDWFNNSAWVGAAIDLTVWQANYVGVPPIVEFKDIKVEHHNLNSNLQTDRTLLGVGALYIDSIPVQFSSNVEFTRNYRTAIAAVSASIKFMQQCIASFDGNQGRNGGAISLLGNSFITASKESFITFAYNSAELKGGAIYAETVSKHDLITSPNCFVRYEDILLPPKEWDAQFIFISNRANEEDNSIYTTTIVPCEWHDSGEQGSGANGTALCWNKWVYYIFAVDDFHVSNCSEQIKTDPKSFENAETRDDRILAYPGEKITLPEQYHMIDDFGNNATERVVFTSSISVKNLSSTANATATIPHYVSDDTITMYGINNTYRLDLYTIDPRVVYTNVHVKLLQCPFGFIKASSNTSKCVCNNEGPLFNSIIQCSSVDYTSRLSILGQWAGVNNNSGIRVAGYCPYTIHLALKELTLPKKTEYPGDHFCAETSRTGLLCGECINGTAPAINSEIYKCVKCSQDMKYYSWLYYFLSEILPLTLFFLILVIFNVSLTSGPANAFIFFSQTISTTFGIYNISTNPYRAFRDIYKAVYGIWNLDILNVLPFMQYCLHSDMTTLQMIALEYVIAIYPLLLIVTLYVVLALYNHDVRLVVWLCRPVRHCSVRLRNTWNPKRSLIDAIAAFILLSYTKMVLISIKLLRYTTLYDHDGGGEGHAVYYDGTMTAYEGQHTGYVLLAFFVLIVFVAIPPTVLLLYPLRYLHLFANKTCGRCCLLGGRFEQFLDAFYGSFKDGTQKGTRDYRFFAGLYLISRAFLAFITFIPSWTTLYLVQNVFCVVAFLSFSSLKPYRNDFHNVFDAAIFALLLVISLLNQYNFNSVYLYKENNVSVAVFTIEYLLIWIPIMYMCWLLLHWIWTKYGTKCRSKRFSSRTDTPVLSEPHTPTSSGLEDDNSIIRLIDERPQMYNYGTISNSTTNSSAGSTRSTGAKTDDSATGASHLTNNHSTQNSSFSTKLTD